MVHRRLLRITTRELLLPAALIVALAGCVTPATRSSTRLSSDAVTIATEPANGIRVRGWCDIAPSLRPIAREALIVRVDAGRCHLTHLGTVRVEVDQQFNVARGTRLAQLTLTTEDGAKVQLAAAGDADGRGDLLRSTGAARVVGGTGRFGVVIGAVRTAGATKSSRGRAEGGTFKIDGWIAYQSIEPSGATERRDR